MIGGSMTKAERLVHDEVEGDPVLFYGARGEWGCFSSFSAHPVVMINPWTWKMMEYRTGEVRFQALKATSEKDHDYVVDAHKESFEPGIISMESKTRGRSIKLRGDWGNTVNSICWYVMLEVVITKVAQHDDVRSELLLTGFRAIYEDSPRDNIWGWRAGSNHNGKNLLGKCWMQARDVWC